MKLKRNEILAPYTTLGIGGPAHFLIEAGTVEEMQEALQFCQKNSLTVMILGKGSNVLFDDAGFDGCVILNKIHFIHESPDGLYRVGAGYSFSLLGTQTARKGWSGLEFASGIPCTVGGAVFMNAGANGKETCEHLASVDYIDESGIFKTIDKRSLSFGYRTSSFQGQKGAIVGATFQLVQTKDAREKQIQIIDYRKRTQPYHEKSAGCAFRNPQGDYAGALIEKCGLKGRRIGGAEVSTMHSNFVINAGGAKSSDILTLIETIRCEVKKEFAIELENEIRYIPFREKGNL